MKITNKQEIRICKNCNTEFVTYKASKQVYCSKKCSCSNPDEIARRNASMKHTVDTKYGGVHYMAHKETRDKHKKTMVEKYGTPHALQNQKCLAKMHDTITEKFGGWHDIAMRGITTRRKIYGTGNNNKKRLQTIYQNRIMKYTHVTPLFEEDEFITNKTSLIYKYPFKCNVCGHHFKISLANGYTPKCKKCAMSKMMTQSKGELSVAEYIRTLVPGINIQTKNYSVLGDLELDIFLPDYNLAIEYDGVVWHSENFGKRDKTYHLYKTNKCIEKGVQLLRIYDIQWDMKKDIIKDIIRHKLNKTENKVFAKYCYTKQISAFEKKKFFEANHLLGDSNSSVNIGLYDTTHELISCISFSKPKFDKKYDYEITRFCNKLNYNIVGGFSKIVRNFISKMRPTNILAYTDRNIWDGGVYIKNKFNKISTTNPNYAYFKAGYYDLFSRGEFTKLKIQKKLPTYNPDLTEWDNMKLNKFDRIWNSGSDKFILNII